MGKVTLQTTTEWAKVTLQTTTEKYAVKFIFKKNSFSSFISQKILTFAKSMNYILNTTFFRNKLLAVRVSSYGNVW